MKTSKKTLFLLAVAAIFTLAISGLYVFLFITVKNKTEATATLSERIDELSGKESRLASSISLLKRESANTEKISSLFFKGNEVVNFAKNIELLGEQSGTTLSIESLEQGSAMNNTPILDLRIKAIGKFSDIERLLMLLENFPGKFEWKTVRLVRDTGADVQVQVGSKGLKQVTPMPMWRAEVTLVALNFIN